jgi:hypothetical protein
MDETSLDNQTEEKGMRRIMPAEIEVGQSAAFKLSYLCVKALQPDPGIFRKWLLF